MLLAGKNAVIFGAGGSLGSTIAKVFATQGARLFISGRTAASVDATAAAIREAGGEAIADIVDALDPDAVSRYVDAVQKKAGKIDIVFNLIGIEAKQNIPLTEMKLDDFEQPIAKYARTHFITGTTVARKMKETGGGVILLLSATPGGIGYANTGGFGLACCVMEAFCRNFASELGPDNIRVVTIRSGGSLDSKVFREAIEQGGPEVEEFIGKMANDTMLKKLPLMDDIAKTAVFLASDWASKITGVTIDVTAGTTTALNYKVTNIAFFEK